MNKGVLCAIAAYLSWGLFPLYWKALHQIPALELICHRIVWSCLTLYVFIAVRGRWKEMADAFAKPRVVGIYLVASLLIGFNWLVFVWGINSGYVIETSLGYFINPLLSVLLGVVLFRERLRPWQWASIALALALSFSLYGLVKKVAPLGSINGLTLETSLLFLPGIAYLGWQGHTGHAAFQHLSPVTMVLVLGSGLVTTFPLVLFAAAAQRIPLAQVGVLQYIAPTLQFLLGAMVFHEKFTATQFGGFLLVWISLALFGIEGGLFYRRHSSLAREATR